LVEQIQPSGIASVVHGEIVSHSHVEVVRPVVGNDDWVFGLRLSSSPPVDDVSLFDVDPAVHPVHGNFIDIEFFEDLVLFSSIVPLDLSLTCKTLLFDELGLVLETTQDYLITSTVDNRVWEDIHNLGKNFLDEGISFVE
jgi:hypothetical protein